MMSTQQARKKHILIPKLCQKIIFNQIEVVDFSNADIPDCWNARRYTKGHVVNKARYIRDVGVLSNNDIIIISNHEIYIKDKDTYINTYGSKNAHKRKIQLGGGREYRSLAVLENDLVAIGLEMQVLSKLNRLTIIHSN